MAVPAAELAAEVAYRIGALWVLAEAAGSRVSYVEPHRTPDDGWLPGGGVVRSPR